MLRHTRACVLVTCFVLALGASAPAQCVGAPSFSPPVPYLPAGGGPVTAIEHADLDGDGDVDLVVCNGSQIVVLRNTGGGTFLPQPPIPSPSPLNDVTVGDFDDDGLADVAGTGTQVTVTGPAVLLQARVVVFLNRTTSGASPLTFAAPLVYPFGPQAPGGSAGRALEAADLNADGILDLVAVDSNSTNVWVLLGHGSFGLGNGTFGTPSPYGGIATLYVDVAVADFNQDGAPDLALIEYLGSVNPTFATILAGQLGPNGLPTGAFALVTNVAIPGPSEARAIVAADVNADGILDLVVANNSAVDVAYGGGGFNFLATAYPSGPYADGLAIGDFTLDGITDIAAARESSIAGGPGNFSVLVGQPAGGFVGYNTLAFNTGYPQCITAADFDGDGRLDVAAGRGTGGVDVRLGTCPQSPTAPSVQVLYPNVGATLVVGQSSPIVWTKSASVGSGAVGAQPVPMGVEAAPPRPRIANVASLASETVWLFESRTRTSA
jgi:hypothetical protein